MTVVTAGTAPAQLPWLCSKRIKKCPDSLFVGAKLGVADNRGRVPAADETYSRATEWTVTDNTKLRFCLLHECGWLCCGMRRPPAH